MARKKQEDPPKGSPAWMATFSDLMNLLLCFFVLLFAMSSVDAEKFQKVVASLQSAFSILPAGGASISDGMMISSGVSQLEMLDSYYEEANTADTESNDLEANQELMEEYEEQALKESEEMAEEIEKQVEWHGLQDKVEVDFNAEYVIINMNGALLFDSGKSELRSEAYDLIAKIGQVIGIYSENVIEVEGHTDNVPIHSSKYEDNNVLSMYRALTVTDYLREVTDIIPAHFKSSGRGEYLPIADNGTPEGRARNRRVEIKIYNSYYSNLNDNVNE